MWRNRGSVLGHPALWEKDCFSYGHRMDACRLHCVVPATNFPITSHLLLPFFLFTSLLLRCTVSFSTHSLSQSTVPNGKCSQRSADSTMVPPDRRGLPSLNERWSQKVPEHQELSPNDLLYLLTLGFYVRHILQFLLMISNGN